MFVFVLVFFYLIGISGFDGLSVCLVMWWFCLYCVCYIYIGVGGGWVCLGGGCGGFSLLMLRDLVVFGGDFFVLIDVDCVVVFCLSLGMSE